MNLEVTKRCNARCDFCDYWKTRDEERLDDYVPVVERLKPVVVMLTGGEPLLRRDLEHLVAALRSRFSGVYLGAITNGALLTVERGLGLWNAGLDQLAVSLDFLDERHDEARGIPGLTAKITERVPALVEGGVSNLVLNTVIKSGNLDQIIPMVHKAEEWGAKISFSAYCDVKASNDSHNVKAGQLSQLREVLTELRRLRQEGRPILSSPYYLDHVAEYFENGGIAGCKAGRRFVTVTPDGGVKRCSEFPVKCHYTDWTPRTFGPTNCTDCWFSCRGETQAPITLDRARQSLKA